MKNLILRISLALVEGGNGLSHGSLQRGERRIVVVLHILDDAFLQVAAVTLSSTIQCVLDAEHVVAEIHKRLVAVGRLDIVDILS